MTIQPRSTTYSARRHAFARSLIELYAAAYSVERSRAEARGQKASLSFSQVMRPLIPQIVRAAALSGRAPSLAQARLDAQKALLVTPQSARRP